MTATSTNDTSPWARYLGERMRERGWGQADLVRASGGAITKSTVSRWLGGTAPDLTGLIAACAALRRPVIEFLLTAGYIRPDEAGGVVERESLNDLDRQALVARGRAVLEELARRIPETAPALDGATVTHLPAHPDDDGLYADGVIFGPTADSDRRNSR